MSEVLLQSMDKKLAQAPNNGGYGQVTKNSSAVQRRSDNPLATRVGPYEPSDQKTPFASVFNRQTSQGSAVDLAVESGNPWPQRATIAELDSMELESLQGQAGTEEAEAIDQLLNQTSSEYLANDSGAGLDTSRSLSNNSLLITGGSEKGYMAGESGLLNAPVVNDETLPANGMVATPTVGLSMAEQISTSPPVTERMNNPAAVGLDESIDQLSISTIPKPQSDTISKENFTRGEFTQTRAAIDPSLLNTDEDQRLRTNMATINSKTPVNSETAINSESQFNSMARTNLASVEEIVSKNSQLQKVNSQPALTMMNKQAKLAGLGQLSGETLFNPLLKEQASSSVTFQSQLTQAGESHVATDTAVLYGTESTTRTEASVRQLTGGATGIALYAKNWQQPFAEQLAKLSFSGRELATIQLDPVELGPLSVKITTQGNEAQVAIHASHPQTRDLLESNQQRLREALEQQGLNMTDFNVFDQGSSGQGASDQNTSDQNTSDQSTAQRNSEDLSADHSASLADNHQQQPIDDAAMLSIDQSSLSISLGSPHTAGLDLFI